MKKLTNRIIGRAAPAAITVAAASAATATFPCFVIIYLFPHYNRHCHSDYCNDYYICHIYFLSYFAEYTALYLYRFFIHFRFIIRLFLSCVNILIVIFIFFFANSSSSPIISKIFCHSTKNALRTAFDSESIFP